MTRNLTAAVAVLAALALGCLASSPAHTHRAVPSSSRVPSSTREAAGRADEGGLSAAAYLPLCVPRGVGGACGRVIFTETDVGIEADVGWDPELSQSGATYAVHEDPVAVGTRELPVGTASLCDSAGPEWAPAAAVRGTLDDSPAKHFVRGLSVADVVGRAVVVTTAAGFPIACATVEPVPGLPVGFEEIDAADYDDVIAALNETTTLLVEQVGNFATAITTSFDSETAPGVATDSV